nr:transcription factor IIIA [Tanacetum cinerariifolium]
MRFVKDKKEHTCLEPGCGKAFKYASKLQKHEEAHVKFETVEAFCAEPGFEVDIMRFVKDKKEHTCLEPGCGKAFKYASKLQKHEEAHV